MALYAGRSLTDGDYTLTVKVEDKAGNTNYSAPLTVTIDTQTSIDRIELLNDTGIVGDNLTNEARPQFHITVPTDVNSVQLSLDGGINWVNATLTSDGVWEYMADRSGRKYVYPDSESNRCCRQHGDGNAQFYH